MESKQAPGLINCNECGRVIPEESHFCQYCGHETPGEEEKKDQERELAEEEKPLLPVLGGVLIIISSALLFVTVWLAHDLSEEGVRIWPFTTSIAWPDWFLIVLLVFGVIGIVGGLSALTRKSQGVALAGGIVSCFGVGTPIGVIGLVLVALSENEFSSQLSDYTELTGTIDEKSLATPVYGWRR